MKIEKYLSILHMGLIKLRPDQCGRLYHYWQSDPCFLSWLDALGNVLALKKAKVAEVHEQVLKLYCQYPNEIQWTCYGHKNYPKNCMHSELAPVAFHYLGNPIWNQNPALAVVGSRNMTEASSSWMRGPFSQFVESCHPLIISGGARGVDQRAHRTAVTYGCPTLVFLPSGVNRAYPAQLEEQYDFLLSTGGAIVSGFLPDQPMRTYHFHRRNAWMAAFSQLILVVQAQIRSGSMLTAKMAQEAGKALMCLPAHPEQKCHQGNLELIRWGSLIVCDHLDLKAAWSSASLPTQEFQLTVQ